MYQLIIADDEKTIRESLSTLVDWNALGFEVVKVFSDGQEIIEYLEYMPVDVIVTDIKMTYLSGLDVARYVSENECTCKVVFISGHQEFDLALSGIKYGVTDYLLKPVKLHSLRETFRKLRASLDEERQKKRNAEEERRKFDESLPFLKERFFTDLIVGVIERPDYVENRMRFLYPGMDLTCRRCIVANVVILNYERFLGEKWKYSLDQLQIGISNFLSLYREGMLGTLVYKSDAFLKILGISLEESCTEEQFLTVFDHCLNDFKESFSVELDYEVIGVYDKIEEILTDRPEHMKREAKEGGRHYFNEQKKLMMVNIRGGNILAAQRLFSMILKELRDIDPVERNNRIAEIFSSMNEVMSAENIGSEGPETFNYATLLSLRDMEQVERFCTRVFDRVKMRMGENGQLDSDNLVVRAKLFIQENLYRDISQEEVASVLYISTGYLSRIFRKQTGESFTQFVTRAKMDKAIELLRDTRRKTYQVGESLGYQTPRYFSKLFRQHTGLTPSEYRSKVLNIGGAADEEG